MRASERGFSLLETVIAIALTTAVLLAVTAAVTHSLHASAQETLKIELRDDALSALADLRASTAYDDALLRRIVGKTSTVTLTRPAGAPTETITLAVSSVPSKTTTARPTAGNNFVAVATATQNAASVTERQTLYFEAPAPGSSVDQSPAPAVR